MSIYKYLSVIEEDVSDSYKHKHAANWKKLLQISTIIFVISSILNIQFFLLLSSCLLFYLACSFCFELGKEHVKLNCYKRNKPDTLISLWPKD